MARKADPTAPSGILIVDKPAGMTSHDVVARVRRLARTRKVGHAGTLDPMATGVLVLGLGKATRLLTWITGDTKAYLATMRLGVTTSTEDAEGQITSTHGCNGLTDAELEAALAPLRGDIMQVPSSVSAIKVDGKRAHALVREGVDVELPARPVHIGCLASAGEPRPTTMPIDEADALRQSAKNDELALKNAHDAKVVASSEYGVPARKTVDFASDIAESATQEISVVDCDLVVDCSSGTYVRALARDIGQHLGVGAHLTFLRRIRVGPFTLNDAHPLAELEEIARLHEEVGDEGRPSLPMMSLDDAVRAMFPELVLNERETELFAHGQAPRRQGRELDALREIAEEDPIAVIASDGQTVMGLAHIVNDAVKTILVFS